MRRQDITIGQVTYIVDLYDAFEDLINAPHTGNFVMIRNGVTVNNVFSDTDILLIEKQILDQCYVEGRTDIDLDKLNRILAFPITSIKTVTNYSSKYTDFNNELTSRTFKIGKSIDIIYGEDFTNPADVPCDKVRIYYPTIKNDLTAILDAEVFMNGIKFHILCRKTDSCEIDSYTEFKIDNESYSEFIEVYIPNLNILLSKDKYYFKDQYNVISFKNKNVFAAIKSETTVETKEIVTSTTKEIQKIAPENPIEEFTNDDPNKIIIDVRRRPSRIIKEITKEVKKNKVFVSKKIFYDETITLTQTTSIKEYDGDNRMFLNVEAVMSKIGMVDEYDIVIYANGERYKNIDFTAFGFKSTVGLQEFLMSYNVKYEIKIFRDDEELNSFVIDTDELVLMGNQIFSSMHLFTMPFMIDESDSLTTSIEKIDGSDNIDDIIAVPLTEKIYCEETNSGTLKHINLPLKFSICPYESIDPQTGRYVKTNEPMNMDIFSRNCHITLENSFMFSTEDSNKGALVLHSHFAFPSRYDNINEAYLAILNESIVNYIVAENEIEYENDDIPEQIKTCGFAIEISTDKKFKDIVFSDIVNIDVAESQCVIDDLNYTLSMRNIDVNWKSYPEFLAIRTRYFDRITLTILESNHLLMTKEMFKYLINENAGRRVNIYDFQLEENEENLEEDEMKINFIDKINCTVVKKTDETEKSTVASRNSTKVLYKPIFYKAKDLEQMKIKSGITQNIGLNLSAMMSKVDTFKILINGVEYPEIGRNDAYVIFKINALELKGAAGQYNLLNQDSEYISDGTWYIY